MSRTIRILIGVLAGIAVIAVCALAVYLLVRPSPEPEATAVPPTSGPAVDDSWDRIQAAGKIVVGTSADYPPFEYYVSQTQIDGFDIALMDEIGRRLGVQVEYRDFAFDGLGPALRLGQIDVAIAAISRTPEREAIVGFSNVYLVSEDGVLAREDASLAIESIDDVGKYKVGVQRSTVHEEWVQTVLIDAGRMSPDNLFAYEKAQDAVRDLREQRVDLMLVDAQAAQAFVDEGGVKLVAKGLNSQHYAIALPKEASSLKDEIDKVITALYNEGVIASLAKEYLGMAQVLPTPTPAPTSTPAPPPECVDGMALVEHVGEVGSGSNQQDEMEPGQAFTKIWRVKNTGTCTWDSSYRLVYVDGNEPEAQMGGEPTAIVGEVAPGQTYDIAVDMVAPLKPGTYIGIWEMENGRGESFGERLKVSVKVLPVPTATSVPTQTPVPGIEFTVDRTQIKEGECVTFSWNVENVKEVYFYAEGQNWWDHGVAGKGSQTECPPVTATYYLRVVQRDNSVEVRQIAIYVESAPDAPQITRFTADPPGQITLGQCVTLRWRVEGEVDNIAITANGGVLWDAAPTKGSYQHCPDTAGTIGYGIEAVGPGGTSRGQQNIRVVKPATATPVPTAAPEQPVIHSFSVSPKQILAGECVGISWSVGGGASHSRILRNGAVVIDDAGFSGQQMDCLDEAGSYTYRLEAYNTAGESVFQEETVSVSEGAPDNPLAGTEWQATTYFDAGSGQMVSVLDGVLVTAAFGDGGSLNGSAGCNSYSSSYLVDGASLAITPPSSTGKICGQPEGIMEQESAFLTLLPSAGSFNIDGGQLFILDASGEVILEFIAPGP